MAYATQADILKRMSETELVQLTDDDGLGVVGEGVVTDAIADADEEIDGYVGGRCEVPLATVPGIVRKLSADIAIYNLFARRSDSVPDTRVERYKAAVRLLEKIAEGKITLGSEDPDGNPPEVLGISYEAEDQVMTTDKLANF